MNAIQHKNLSAGIVDARSDITVSMVVYVFKGIERMVVPYNFLVLWTMWPAI